MSSICFKHFLKIKINHELTRNFVSKNHRLPINLLLILLLLLYVQDNANKILEGFFNLPRSSNKVHFGIPLMGLSFPLIVL
jgi:hypothetical protein